MEITHYGHSCVLLDTGSARLLIDPGAFSQGFEGVTGLDAVLITHQHADHLDPDRLPALLAANPDARLIVDPDTATQLPDGVREHEPVGPGETLTVGGSRIEVLGGAHAVIHPDVPVITNNAYLVDGTHLHPGDAIDTYPPAGLEVLFLPAVAPWSKIGETIDHLRAVAPRTAVPIHQAILSEGGIGFFHGLLDRLGPQATTFRPLEAGVPTEL